MRPQTVTDEQILKVARKVFLENGPQASVDLIAKELNLSQPALFKRFGTKRALMVKAMQAPKEIKWFEIIDKGPDDRPFPEQLKEVAEIISKFLKTIQPVMQFIQTTDISPMELMADNEIPPPVKGILKLTAWLERCYEKGLIREVNFQQAAVGIMGTIQFNTFAKTFLRSFGMVPEILNTENSLDGLPDLIWNGLKRG